MGSLVEILSGLPILGGDTQTRAFPILPSEIVVRALPIVGGDMLRGPHKTLLLRACQSPLVLMEDSHSEQESRHKEASKMPLELFSRIKLKSILGVENTKTSMSMPHSSVLLKNLLEGQQQGKKALETPSCQVY